MTRQQGKDELFNKWGHNSPLEKKKKKLVCTHHTPKAMPKQFKDLNVEREIIK